MLKADESLHSFSNLYRSVPGKKVLSGWVEANALQLSSTAADLAFVKKTASPRTEILKDICIMRECGKESALHCDKKDNLAFIYSLISEKVTLQMC